MRLDGWESRLAALLEDARHKPYALGEHDCFRLACGAVEGLTGVDRWPEFAGYRTRREALALIAQHGRSFEEAFDWFFGIAAVDARLARRGDVLMLVTPRGWDGSVRDEAHLGVCNGAQTAFLAPDGLLWIPTVTCLACWRVG